MLSRSFFVLFLLLAVCAAFGQNAEPASQYTLTDAHLKEVGLRFAPEHNSLTDLAQAAAKQNESQVITLDWNAFPSKTGPITASEAHGILLSHKMEVDSRKYVSDPPSSQDGGQMWSDYFLFVAVNKKNQIRGVLLARDPRLMFWDVADEKGNLRGGILYQSKCSFTLRFPNAPDIKRIVVYESKQNTHGFRLEEFARIELPRDKK